MLKINIIDINCLAQIGIYDWEQEKKQALKISVEITLNSNKSMSSDLIEDTVDYEYIQNEIINIAETKPYASRKTSRGYTNISKVN